jgi:hypothetical protein
LKEAGPASSRYYPRICPEGLRKASQDSLWLERSISRIREQSSNLLLAFASTVILGFGPRRDPWSYFFSFQNHIYVLKWGLFDERKCLWTTADSLGPPSRWAEQLIWDLCFGHLYWARLVYIGQLLKWLATVRFLVERRNFLFSPSRPDRLWGPLSHLPNWHSEFFP